MMKRHLLERDLAFCTRFFRLLRFSLVTILIFASITGCGNSSSGSGITTTMLVYIEGTDLEDKEGEGVKNIQEMLAANSSARINVVLATGAAMKETGATPVRSWKTLKRHVLRNGQIIELQDLGVQDMGKTDTLKDFIVWGQTAYPADRYILVLWDHGGGSVWGYGGYKDQNGNVIASSMTVPDIRKAIGDAFTVTQKGFAIIGFDACLMATVEAAHNLSPFARYLVASQEYSTLGWDYTAFLNALAAAPDTDGLTVAKIIAETWAQKCRKINVTGYTMSVIDLAKIAEVVAAVNDLGVIANAQLALKGQDAWVTLASARVFADEFGADYTNHFFFNMTDIGGYAEQLALVDKPVYGTVGARIRSALTQAVSYNVKETAHGEATGLSMYVPFHTFAFARDRERSVYGSISFADDYKSLINTYVNYPLDNPPGGNLKFSGVAVSGNDMTATFSSPLNMSEMFVDITQPVSGTSMFRKLSQDLVRLNAENEVKYTRTNLWFTLDGNPVIGYFEKGPGLFDGLETYDITIPVRHRRAGTDAASNKRINILVRYQRVANTGSVVMLWEASISEVFSRWPVNLEAGDFITPILEQYDPATPSQKTEADGTAFNLSTADPVFKRAAIPSGTYYYNFRIVDLGGNLMKSAQVPSSH